MCRNFKIKHIWKWRGIICSRKIFVQSFVSCLWNSFSLLYVSLRDKQVVHLCNKVEVIRANREKHYRFVYRVQLIFRDTKHNCKDIFSQKKSSWGIAKKFKLVRRFSQLKSQHHMLVQSRANILEIRMNVNKKQFNCEHGGGKGK